MASNVADVQEPLANTRAVPDWVAVAHELGQRFGGRAEAHDRDDTFAADNYADLRAVKLFSAAVPAELGGGGATYADICEVIRVLGRHCGSTALAFSMHSHLLAAAVWRHQHNGTPPAEPFLRRVAAEELVLVSSGGSDWLDGSGTLERVEGGYRLTGRKIFGSGAPAGDLLMTTGVYQDPTDGPMVLHFGMSLHDSSVQIQDTWRALGMRATGSHDILIESLFVPDQSVAARRPQGRWHLLLDVISPFVWPLVLSAYRGVAETARDIAVELVAKRAADPVVQALVGEMDTALTTAQIVIDDMVRIGGSDYTPGVDISNRTYMAKTAAAQALLSTVEKAMDVASGAAFYRSLGLERRFRDIQGVRYHPFQERKQALFTGRLALGLDPITN